ncbi:plasmid pRiA4b ORF-3 family protein [uncultured Comamonas sp.]|uniref:plasmid pRiA4b ORF-3 family protein n=1 Tax=uncultured Comamonas sp. TaxID=114710 RepID=UPI003748DA72
MASKAQWIKTPTAILQLHNELRGIRPKVWRRVLVQETITLIKLHQVIQATFGWGHSHLHEFIASYGERYGTPDPLYDEPGSITSESTRLTTALNRSTLSHVYDFGDYWDQRIKVEKKLASDPLLPLPLCAGGACSAPPEDCGGALGYAQVVQAMANPDDPEHDNMVEWISAYTWDPLAFDTIKTKDRLDTVEAVLDQLRSGPAIYPAPAALQA